VRRKPKKKYSKSHYKPLLESQRKRIKKRDGYKCFICQRDTGKGRPTRKANIHHILGRKVPDADNDMHLILLCSSCHEVLSELTYHSRDWILVPGVWERAKDLATYYINANP
jgi:5-methylcytosine-specific restriction endonuclease McrA